MIPYDWLEQARARIGPFINNTPLTYDPHNDLFLKWENHQVTGSFKVRGALNKIFSLQNWELERGIITASAGNHGQGVALAASMKHVHVKVFASEHATPNKIRAMSDLGAEIILIPGGYAEAESAGISAAKTSGATWISPYNDGVVIAGQGTLALEVQEEIQAKTAVTWVVPAGGGGLVSGIGCAVSKQHPKPGLIAVQSEASPFLHAIFHHGSQEGVTELPSLADGLAGAVENGSVTIPLVMSYVVDFKLVSEDEIRQAIKYAWINYHEIIEGSAAVSLAALLSGKINSRPAIVVISGGNINPGEHGQIINDSKIGLFS